LEKRLPMSTGASLRPPSSGVFNVVHAVSIDLVS